MTIEKLTIITTVSNNSKTLVASIESVLAQKVKFRFKLVLVDTGSSDDSVSIIKSYAQKYPAIVQGFFLSEGCNHYISTLRALEYATTDYVCFLNADDYWIDVNHLQSAYDFLEKNLDYSIYTANVLLKNNKTDIVEPHISVETVSATYEFEQFLSGSCVFSYISGMFFRNITFKAGVLGRIKDNIGTPAERTFSSDCGWYVVHLKYGKALYINRPCGVHVMSDSTLSGNLSRFEQLILNAQQWLDYYHYFDNTHPYVFFGRIWGCIGKAFEELQVAFHLNHELGQDETIQALFLPLYAICTENKQYISQKRKSFVAQFMQKFK